MLAIVSRRILPTAALLLLAAAAPGSAKPTPSSFDGHWSVVIITDTGSCDRSYRYGLVVSSGRIHDQGGTGVLVSGAVDRRGRVSVSLRYGEAAAQGNGRLSASDGAGRWHSASSGARCSGHWLAERRD